MSEAYEVLKDDEKRARYDQYGEMGVNENGGGYQASNVNMDELLRHFADIFGGEARSYEGFGGFSGFGNYGYPNEVDNNGSNIAATISIPFLDCVNGCERDIRVSKEAPCARCHGSGTVGVFISSHAGSEQQASDVSAVQGQRHGLRRHLSLPSYAVQPRHDDVHGALSPLRWQRLHRHGAMSRLSRQLRAARVVDHHREDPSRHRQRRHHPPGGSGQRGHAWRAAGEPVHHGAGGAGQLLQSARGGRVLHGADLGDDGHAGRNDHGAHAEWCGGRARAAGHAVQYEDAAAEQGAASHAVELRGRRDHHVRRAHSAEPDGGAEAADHGVRKGREGRGASEGASDAWRRGPDKGIFRAS